MIVIYAKISSYGRHWIHLKCKRLKTGMFFKGKDGEQSESDLLYNTWTQGLANISTQSKRFEMLQHWLKQPNDFEKGTSFEKYFTRLRCACYCCIICNFYFLPCAILMMWSEQSPHFTQRINWAAFVQWHFKHDWIFCSFIECWWWFQQMNDIRW